MNPFIACTDVNRPFYNKVLNDFETDSYFIALNVKSSSYKGRIITENNNLFNYLKKVKGLDKDSYLLFMKRTLAHNKVLKIDSRDFSVWNFKKVREVAAVVYNANKGRDSFVAHYFNGTMLNYGITDEERYAVINQLFYWEYPVKIDKITGNLIIG